ncbi:hypothetical protein UCREL1_7746 [Eutypa lata UCREL1]|uniref:Uncharacterized protein n=1 Tax=Eutypa lata (strain UCR-EL1) TaxID=1287681 RepID=M7SM56_EUTLA|nr:hypothetical protein UCREL1_7746 [Eutypa lata UCREL1]
MVSKLESLIASGSLLNTASELESLVTNGSLFNTVHNGYPLYPQGAGSPGAELTIFPNDTTVLSFNSSGLVLDLALPIFTQILDADRELFPISCTYALSGQYDHLPRVLFYVLIVFAFLFRHRTTIAKAALGVVMSYSATACIHLFVLMGFYRFGLPDTIGHDVEDATAYGDVDIFGIAPVVTVSAIVLIPILTWSESFKGNRGKAIIVYWSILIFVCLAVICYYAITFGEGWYFNRIQSVASCKKDCPRPGSLETVGFPLWNIDDYNSDDCDCVDFCGLISPEAPLREKQGMVPILYYGPALKHYCDGNDSLCLGQSDSAHNLLLGVISLWFFSLFLGLVAFLGVNSSSESVRNMIFRLTNATFRDVITAIFKGSRQQTILKKMRLQNPHDPHTFYRRLRRLFAKSVATLYYGLAFVGLLFSPVLFVVSITAVELFIGSLPTSERSDAIGSWAPWVAAMMVLLSSAIMHLNGIVIEHVSTAYRKIRRFVQYDSEERRHLDIADERQPHVEPFIDESIAHTGYVIMYTWWYLAIRAKAFIEWWKDPEKYSTNEYRGHGVLEG